MYGEGDPLLNKLWEQVMTNTTGIGITRCAAWVFAAAVCLSTTVPGQAEEQAPQTQAQPAGVPQGWTRAAISAFERGNLALQNNNYTDAANHFQQAAGHLPEDAHQMHISLLAMAGQASHEAANFTQAEDMYTHALARAESHLPDDPLIATVLNKMALLYQDTNRLKDAEPLMKRALKINENALGPDHPKVIKGHKDLAELLQDSSGPDQPNMATDINSLALFYLTTGRFEEAEPLFERVLKINNNLFGADHPKVAISFNNLALLYLSTDRFEEAEPLFERALNINENSFGADHPDVARSLGNLAQLYQDTNRLKEAESLYERAVTIFTTSLGTEHPNTQAVADSLATLRAEMGEGKQ